eukprot:1849231-Pleurochrysis_carterae.AAC.2
MRVEAAHIPAAAIFDRRMIRDHNIHARLVLYVAATRHDSPAALQTTGRAGGERDQHSCFAGRDNG